MTRHLPEKPHLEYLKKQAKELLPVCLRQTGRSATHALAREYSFTTWAKLKSHVEALGITPAELWKPAVCDTHAARVQKVLSRFPELARRLTIRCQITDSAPTPCSPAVQPSDRATIDALLRAGANINKRTEWWTGGFGVLDDCHPDLADLLIGRPKTPRRRAE